MRAPLLHLRPDFREVTARGGIQAGITKRSWPAWRLALPATLRAMRRWHPDSVMLSMPKLERDALARAIWEQGFRAGAGYKP